MSKTLEKFRGRRVLVTGAAGFIGAHMTSELIGSGATVYAQLRASTDRWRLDALGLQPETLVCDLTDFDRVTALVDELRPEYVFHLAVKRDHHDWRQLVETNITATMNLLHASAHTGLVRFFCLGSSLEFGSAPPAPGDRPVLSPATYYGAARASASLLLRQAIENNNMPVTIARAFYVYGPLQPATRLIPAVITAAADGTQLSLTAPGTRRDFVYVQDVVDACLKAASAHNALGSELTLGSGVLRTNEEVVEKIALLSQRHIFVGPEVYKSRPWDTQQWTVKPEDGAGMIGWTPRVSIDDGLSRCIEWQKHYRR